MAKITASALAAALPRGPVVPSDHPIHGFFRAIRPGDAWGRWVISIPPRAMSADTPTTTGTLGAYASMGWRITEVEECAGSVVISLRNQGSGALWDYYDVEIRVPRDAVLTITRRHAGRFC